MLNNDILKALAGYTDSMTKPVSFVLQAGSHSKRAELVDFLQKFCGVSEKLTFEERDMSDTLRSPISFTLLSDNQPTGVIFSGIPGGHEFNSLVLAMLHAGGREMKIDKSVADLVAGIEQDMHFEVFVSLSCHNCPDVVQALNQFALLNPRISSEMIDGGLFQDEVKKRDLQGVPAVYLNGEMFANGKVDTAILVEKLMAVAPAKAPSDSQLPMQDVTVIGGGPAGVAAAIYSARKGLKVTIVADRFGGQVKDTMGIENLISVKETTGPKLSGNLREHMEAYDVNLREHLKVDSLEQGDIKRITLSSGEVIQSRSVILATGARWRELGVPGEKENIGNGVAYCPHCDGPFFKGKDVAVIGGGNSGIEAALDLAGIVKSVTVLEFGDTLRADQVLVDQARKRDNIRIITSAQTTEVTSANGKVDGLNYIDRESGESHRVELAGVFVQIGLVPNSQFVADVVSTTKHGEIIIDERCHTSESGIYACGDVTTVPFKQIVIAMGEGSKAALSAFEYLLKTPVPSSQESEAKAA
jgi:alkyl hydroperoxide reductase subunit F